ncbi:PRD domain-containing protein [Metabacillus litoralis]|nr:PRD domain-containing protein [Metabacillus litoralis]UHA62715.1 PRD domain-containing protein [Metabacillus litoralis]
MLKSGLIVHVHSVINRIKYGFPITNPLLPNIKKCILIYLIWCY